jgi:hypothetical protein
MNKKHQRVHTYFEYIERYAFGDLNLFHKIAIDAEAEENNQGSTSSSTTAYEATKYHSGSAGAEPYPDFVDKRVPFEVVNRATIPFTLMIFSCMDALGYLIREDHKAEDENAHTKTNKNITGFFKFVSPYPTKEEIECLVAIFRHGLGHNYFPKLGHAISYHSNNPKDKLFFLDVVGVRVVLNVNRLENYFKVGFDNIKGSEPLYDQISNRLEKINLYYLKHDEQKVMDVICRQMAP